MTEMSKKDLRAPSYKSEPGFTGPKRHEQQAHPRVPAWCPEWLIGGRKWIS